MVERLFAKVRPQILFIVIALVLVTYFVISDDLDTAVKGTIIGGVVGGMIAIGKDLIQLDKEKGD